MGQSRILRIALAVGTAGVVSVSSFAATDARSASTPTAEVSLKLVGSGATKRLGSYHPLRLKLGKPKPQGLKAAPDMSAPLYGQLMFDGKSYLIAVDEPANGDSKIYVDLNGNGDLTDDLPVAWEKVAAKAPDGSELQQYSGNFKLPIQGRDGSKPELASIGAYRFDPKDPQRKELKWTLLYYADYAYEGTVKLGGQSYKAMLADDNADGTFSGKGNSPSRILLDVNGDGLFANKGEIFDSSKPFNIKGTTWAATPSKSGEQPVAIAKSNRSVPEIAPPPNHTVGQLVTPFKAKRMDGKIVSFPEDYKGKVVLLDFWATWCGPCMNEVPGVVAAYKTYQPKGLEILGISLDDANAAREVKSVTAEHGMTWPQVHDGKAWKGPIVETYNITGIPTTFLVDGDTGRILATRESLWGEYLDGTLDKAFTKRSESKKPVAEKQEPAEETGL